MHARETDLTLSSPPYAYAFSTCFIPGVWVCPIPGGGTNRDLDWCLILQRCQRLLPEGCCTGIGQQLIPGRRKRRGSTFGTIPVFHALCVSCMHMGSFREREKSSPLPCNPFALCYSPPPTASFSRRRSAFSPSLPSSAPVSPWPGLPPRIWRGCNVPWFFGQVPVC